MGLMANGLSLADDPANALRVPQATVAAPSPAPRTNGLTPMNPFMAQKPKMQNGLIGSTLDAFQRGFDPQGRQARLDQNKSDDKEARTKELATLQHIRKLPMEQRLSLIPQLSQSIGQPIPESTMSDAEIDAQIAMRMGDAGMVEEPMSAYQKAQLEAQAAKEGKPQLFNTPKGIVSIADGEEPDLVYGTEADEEPPWTGAIKNPQTGQWEFDPNYIKGYRQMHPGSAQSGIAPPSGYRWAVDANGQQVLEKITGGPADKPEFSPAQEGKYKKQAGALNSIQFAVQEYRDAVNKYGTRLIANPNDADTAELEASHTNLMMLLKSPEMFALGVLTGPDLEILEKSVTPPTGWKSAGANAETIGARLGVLDRFIAQQRGQIPEQFVDGGTGGSRPQGSASRAVASGWRTASGIPGAPRQAQDDGPDVEAILNEALGPDDEDDGDLPPGVTQEEWDNMDEQDRALFR